MEIYIVLEYYNDYDQHGGYFIDVFRTYEAALKLVGHTGRLDNEYSWYEIEKEII